MTGRPYLTDWNANMKSADKTTGAEATRQNAFTTTPPPQGGKPFRIWAVCFVAAIGGFLFGYDLSLIGAANVYLRDQFHLSTEMLGFTTASAALGCVFGPIMGAWLCDAIGRERTMLVSALLLGVGALMTAFAPTIFLFNVFRIIGGVGVGLCSVASPMYIAEVAPPKKRGSLGVMYQLAIVVGSTVAPLVCYGLVRVLPDTVSWRWMFGSQMVVVAIFVVFLLVLPRSPRWLARRGRYDEAKAVLIKLHGTGAAEAELDEIRGSLNEETGSWNELFRPGLRYALLIGLLLAFYNNWTGWSAMGGYIPMLFEMSGVQERHVALLQFSITYLAMAVLTLVAMWSIDRVGRRPLWLVASGIMAVVTATTGAVFYYHLQGWPVLLVLVLCTIPHGLALGPLPWLMMSEIFPTHLRAKATALTTTFLWCVIFSAAQLFPMLMSYSERRIGSPAGVFWIFTAVCFTALLFGWKMLPETKGRTLEEISQHWTKRKEM
jgi:MFS transporter, SP family, arabinose:H+ symporter